MIDALFAALILDLRRLRVPDKRSHFVRFVPPYLRSAPRESAFPFSGQRPTGPMAHFSPTAHALMRILIIEDNVRLSGMVIRKLEEAGHQVIAKAATIDEGLLEASACDCQVAILDVDLCGVNSGPVAETLRSRGIPFLVTCGAPRELSPEHQSATLLTKPYKISDMLAMIAALQPKQEQEQEQEQMAKSA